MRTGQRRVMRAVAVAVAAVLVVGWGRPASAIIRVDFPVARVYKEAQVVVIGEATRTAPGQGSIACSVSETLKGQSSATMLPIELPAALAGQVKPGNPIVAFMHGDRGIFHLADAWYAAERRGGGRWAVTGPYPMVKNYPGRTDALVDILQEIKAGRRGIQDGIGHEFIGTLRDHGNVGVKPTYMIAADVTGNNSPDAIISSQQGVRLWVARGDKFVDVSEAWGLKDVTGRCTAAGDVNGDGKADLLIGTSLWLQGQRRFAKSDIELQLPDEETWAAAALDDINGDRQADVVVLSRNGELTWMANPGLGGGKWSRSRAGLWAGKKEALAAVFSHDWGDTRRLYVMVVHADDIVRYPLQIAGEREGDFHRLTGLDMTVYPKIGPMPMQVDLCAGLDYDGNGLTDLLLVTKGGGITLANRGYGAYLINGFMHTQFRTDSTFKPHPKIPKMPFEISPAVRVAPGKRAGQTGKGNAQNLLLLRPDGQLFEMINNRK